MLLLLFYVGMLVYFIGTVWMARMQDLVVRHRREVIELLGTVTVALPDVERDAAHAINMALLARQEEELRRMRPFGRWWRG